MPYLYKTTLFKSTANVISPPPTNDADKTDFETNFKAQAQTINEIVVSGQFYIVDLSYANFKARIVSPITWANVLYIENSDKYILYLTDEETGLRTYRKISAQLNGTGEVIKSIRGKIYGWSFFNKCTTRKYVKLYDKATAPVSTDIPKITIPCEPNNKPDKQYFSNGIEFENGIGIRTTDGSADADVAAPGDCLTINIWFY